SPDWQHVLLIEIGPSLSTSSGAVTYDQFFGEIAAYEQANLVDQAGHVDTMLSTTLRSHLTSDMQYSIFRDATPAGLAVTVPLSLISGSAGDGTWMLVRYNDLASLVVTIGGVSVSLPDSTKSDVPLAVLKLDWDFINVHDGSWSCFNANVYYAANTC